MATANAGRKAKPTGLKLIEGRGNGRDSGGRPIKETPAFVRLPPEPPDLLWGDAKDEWERVVPELQRLELIKPIDAASLTAYCLTWQRLCQAQRMIDASSITVDEVETRGGLLHNNSQGLTRHPAVAIVEAASKELRAWAAEFGLTPAAEGKVSRPEGGGGEDNPFA